jgi:myo-inositol 2-dehydrogenase/D-chiro-inositol 1-dehydrogenase
MKGMRVELLKFGLIGCGNLGKEHAKCISEISGAYFSAYADVNESSADSFLKTYGGDYATTDMDKVLNDKSIKAVYICTWHDSHASLVIRAAKAGKHIFIEKPLSLKIDECESIDKEVKKAGVYLMPAYKMRYYPLVQKAHEFIPEPQVIVGQMMDSRWPDGLWAQDPIKGGGNVHSQGCHTTDILRFFAGSEPVRIWAAGGAITHPGHLCIDQCVATIQFANGHIASWIQGDASPSQYTGKFFFELFGNGGRSVQLYDRLKKATFFDGKKTWTEERAEEEGYMLENKEFVAALLENREPGITTKDGLQSTRIVLAADKAIRTGEVQEL